MCSFLVHWQAFVLYFRLSVNKVSWKHDIYPDIFGLSVLFFCKWHGCAIQVLASKHQVTLSTEASLNSCVYKLISDSIRLVWTVFVHSSLQKTFLLGCCFCRCCYFFFSYFKNLAEMESYEWLASWSATLTSRSSFLEFPLTYREAFLCQNKFYHLTAP